MVLVAAMRQMYLVGQRHDLEYQIDMINSNKANILASINTMVPNGVDMEPDSPEVKIMEQRKQRLMLIDKKLDQDLTMAQNKLAMLNSQEREVSQGLARELSPQR